VVEPGEPALEEIARRFPGVVGPDGRLDRAKLGEAVFGDDEARAALNAITHPRIRERAQEKIRELAERGVDPVIYDAALLIENRLHEGMDGVILVAAPKKLQLERLMARNGLSREQAETRVDSQLPLGKKRPFATWVIENDGPLERTRKRVEEIWNEIQG
jgi:dephospho-CoA kinase